ncbi:MAG TPA: hypothetical protein VFU88_16100 [Ktedonobacterales bacterium]|nr:hypothetical protein [Ktedonobacterales bacterium]
MSDTHETDHDQTPEVPTADAGGEGDPAATLAALLADLSQLRDYLQQRGRHTYDLAQRFMHNAQRDAASRAYDERQATMLEYQHYIWHEIAGLVNKLLVTYGEPEVGATSDELPSSDDAGQPNGAAGE